jgi:hypothetical protein
VLVPYNATLDDAKNELKRRAMIDHKILNPKRVVVTGINITWSLHTKKRRVKSR